MSRTSIAVFGGTFDPIHHGHLRSALELKETLAVDELRLMPSHKPPLRGAPGASSTLRLAMVAQAIVGEPGLTVEGRELQRSGPSYSADTLADIRRDCGPDAALIFIVGSDAFNQLHRWHDWQRIFDSAHVVVLERPEFPLAIAKEVEEFLAPRWLNDSAGLLAEPCGNIHRLHLSQLAISATDIRHRIARGLSVRYLLPEGVRRIINEQGLYRPESQETHH